jgi:hypothetical protein
LQAAWMHGTLLLLLLLLLLLRREREWASE